MLPHSYKYLTNITISTRVFSKQVPKMEHRFQRQGFIKSHMNMKMICFNVFFMFLMVARLPNVSAYKNYTVGDSLGWFDKLEKPTVDYDKWVSGKSFSLGDFLVFNTDNNHTVIQTKNISTYKSCDTEDENAIQWSLTNPNSTVVNPITIFVPLTKEGPTYFFSSFYDGEQCLHGQKFAINVTHGQGLPPNLALGPTPANSAPSPANADAGGDDQAAPDTVVPANFNHPKNVPEEDSSSDDTKKSNDASFMSNKKGILVSLIGGILVFIWTC